MVLTEQEALLRVNHLKENVVHFLKYSDLWVGTLYSKVDSGHVLPSLYIK